MAFGADYLQDPEMIKTILISYTFLPTNEVK
jgi:hypothetical protein